MFLKVNPLNAELNPICYFLALLGAHHFLQVSRITVNRAVETESFSETSAGFNSLTWPSVGEHFTKLFAVKASRHM